MRVQVPPSAQNIFVTRTDLMNKLLLLLFTTLTFSNSYNDASIAFESKEYKLALDAINEIIQNDKGNHKAFYLASKIYYAVGDLDNANSSIIRAIESENDSEEYRDYQKKLENLKTNLKSAQKTFDNGYVDDALLEYSSLINNFPDSPIPLYSMGQVYLKSNNYKMAVQNFNKAIDMNPYEKEKYNKSISSISQRIAKSGDGKFRVKEYEEALQLYLEAVSYNPSFVAVLYRITNVYQQMRDYDNAKIYADKTLFYDPVHYKAMKTLGDLYYKLGDLSNSIASYNESISTNPQYYKAYYSLSKVLNEQGKTSDAILNLDTALSINPKYDKAYILLGVIYSDNSKYEEAIYNFNRAIDINGKNYKLYWRLAETYNRSEQYSQAKDAAKKSLKIKRNYAGAFFELGYSELYMCNKVAAIDAFDKAKKDKTYRKSSKHYLDNIDQLFAQQCK